MTTEEQLIQHNLKRWKRAKEFRISNINKQQQSKQEELRKKTMFSIGVLATDKGVKLEKEIKI